MTVHIVKTQMRRYIFDLEEEALEAITWDIVVVEPVKGDSDPWVEIYISEGDDPTRRLILAGFQIDVAEFLEKILDFLRNCGGD